MSCAGYGPPPHTPTGHVHDQAIELTDRVAGDLLLLYGQQLSAIEEDKDAWPNLLVDRHRATGQS